MLLDDIADYLYTTVRNAGTIRKGYMPTSPDICTGLFEYGAGSPILHFGTAGVQYEFPSLQVRCRGEKQDYEEPRLRIEEIYRQLSGVQGMTLGATYYLMIRPLQSPFFLQRDEGERVIFNVNFIVEKGLSAS